MVSFTPLRVEGVRAYLSNLEGEKGVTTASWRDFDHAMHLLTAVQLVWHSTNVALFSLTAGETLQTAIRCQTVIPAFAVKI